MGPLFMVTRATTRIGRTSRESTAVPVTNGKSRNLWRGMNSSIPTRAPESALASGSVSESVWAPESASEKASA